MTARVLAIVTAPKRGTLLQPVSEAALEAGKGLVGDRYYAKRGTFSEKLKDKADWELTLIESEEIDRFNASQASPWSLGSFRRNIVTSGVKLNDLVGARFRVGAAVVEGVRLCEPCAHLAKLLDPGVVAAMTHRAGLRARIIEGAVIRPGDEIHISDAAKQSVTAHG
jgi:MOSC domain-containing protein YiiM